MNDEKLTSASEVAGKTIARIEENSPRPWDGHPSEEYALIHLTDGTALEISAGAAYEAAS